MKKIFLLALALCLTVPLGGMAQEFEYELQFTSPFSFGIKAGVNMSYSSWNPTSASSTSMNKKGLFGIQLGAVGEYMATDHFFVEASFSVISKGARVERVYPTVSRSYKFTESYNPAYLHMPVMAGWKFPIGDQTQLYVSGGGYAAYGVGGKYIGDLTYPKVEGLADIDKDRTEEGVFTDNRLKRFDAGLIAGAGVEWNGFFLGLNYEYGFTDIARTSLKAETGEYRNRTGALVFGYKF